MKAIDTDSELLDMTLELMALTQKTDNPYVKKLLGNFSTGLSGMEAEDTSHPFLEPVPLQQPDFSFLGNGKEVGDLHCKIIDNTYVSVWRCNNFWFRWRFLIDGMIALELWNTPPPIGLRLDVAELGFKEE